MFKSIFQVSLPMESNGLEKLVNDKSKCSNCGSNEPVYIPARGELVCSKCGLVLYERLIDSGAEWTAFDKDEVIKKERCSPMTSGHIYPSKKLSYNLRSQVYRWRHLLGDYKEKRLIDAMNEFKRVGWSIECSPKVIETGFLIYEKACSKDMLRGRHENDFILACLYAASRIRRVPLTLNYLSSILAEGKDNVRKIVGGYYREIVNGLSINIPVINPIDYIPRICTELSLSYEVQAYAFNILKKAKEAGITQGKCPIGFAAAAIYLASKAKKDDRTQKQISKVCKVTTVTIRKDRSRLSEILD